jgi:RNA polymerase sigma-70 factor, ECF subfamily
LKSAAEKKLVRRLRMREQRAFEQLVGQFQTPIFNLVYRMLGSREEAEDIAQEVFVTVFKKIDTFRGDSSLSTWIYRIATNHCKNRKKYLGRRQYDRVALVERKERILEGPQTVATSGQVSRPDEMAEGLQTERLIQDAINALDEDHRLILVLRDVQNMSYDDISTITGLALGTVKSRLHRARMSLKEKLSSHLR